MEAGKCVGHPVTQAMKAQTEIGGVAALIFNLGARLERVISTTPQPLYPRGEAGWAPEPVCTRVGNPAPCRGRTPNFQARS